MSFGGVFRKAGGGSLGSPNEVKALLMQAFPTIAVPFVLERAGNNIAALDEKVQRIFKLFAWFRSVHPTWYWSFSMGEDAHAVEITFGNTSAVKRVFMQIYGRGNEEGFQKIQSGINYLIAKGEWAFEWD